MEHIIEILVWPLTIIVIVMLLRAPLSELVPTLKKLKYKDLELEFEREANKILAEAERDLPEALEEKKQRIKTTDVMFSRSRPEPATEILESWRNLELNIRDLAKEHNVQGGRSTRSLVDALVLNGLISKEGAAIILDLAAFRNKVAHTNEEVISYEVSSAFSGSVKRVIESLNNKNT